MVTIYMFLKVQKTKLPFTRELAEDNRDYQGLVRQFGKRRKRKLSKA